MRAFRVSIIIAVLFVMAWNTGCSQSNASLATGMKMQDAVSEMKKRGLSPQQMAYATSHSAFDLKDGRTIVLLGDKLVDEIQIIANPDDPKSSRKTKTVAGFKF